MKYKVGDKVKVRRDLETGKLYYMEDGSEWNSVIGVMLEFRGKVAEISNICSGQYVIIGTPCLWTDEMFEGLAEEPEFHVYDTVRHEKYGLGTVIQIGETVIVVDFDDLPFDRPALINNVLYCSKRELTLVEAYIGGEDE